MALKSQGQCIRTYQYTTTVSNNLGLPQVMSDCGYTTTNYLLLENVIVGEDYIFTNTLGTLDKYITVTDLDNVEIAQGFSPLTVSGISSASVRVHLSDDDSCAGTDNCHTVTAQIVLDCPVPSGAAVSEIGTDTATFAWESGGSETAWEVIALPAASAPPANDLVEGVTVVNDNPVHTAALLPAMTYTFYYRAVCAEGEKSPWNSTDDFTTLCEAVAYFSEGFDSGSTLPTCYAKVGTEGSVSVQSESGAASAPNVLYLGSGGILSLPEVSNFAEATHRIKFKLRSIYSLGGSVEFGYLLDLQDANSFVLLETFASNSVTVYNEYTFEPDAFTENGNFAFRHIAEGNNSVILDDIIWEPVPACEDVASFKIDNYTSTTAALSWTSEDAAWEVAYGVAATTANPNDLTAEVVEVPSVALSNLEPATAYKVWVRANCGDGAYGAWIGPRTVTTTCAPVATFSENFNASNAIPACFKRVGNGGNAYIQSSALYLSSYEDGNAGNAMSYGMVALPPVSNAAAGTHRLKFLAKASGPTGGVLEFGYLTNPGDGASFVAVQSFTAASTAFETFIYIPAAGAITAEVMAFRHSGNPSFAVQVDDLVWETAPNCSDVTAIQAKEISNASAKIQWTGNSETDWQVAYGAVTVTDPNTLDSVAVGDAPDTVISGLGASTTYKVWVRSNCNELGFGAWAGPIEFTTACNALTDFAESFDGSNDLPACWTQVGTGFAFIQSGSSNSVYTGGLAILAAPPVSNASAGTHRLKFKAKGAYDIGGVIEVGYLTSYNDGSTFVALQSFTPSSAAVYDEFYANLGTAPATAYLALKHTGTSFNAVSIDDVVWEPLPECEAVMGLKTDAVASNSVTVSWTASYSTAWEIAYTTGDDDTPLANLPVEAAEATSFTFENLDPDTAYKFWVRTDCGNGEYGAWIGPKQFRTACEPLTDLPWLENFDSVELPGLPQCWTEENGDWELTDAVSISIPYSGGQYIRVYNNVENGYMWTPGFQLEAGQAYDFSTFVQGDGYDGWSVAMLSNTAPAAQGAVQMGAAYEVPAGAGTQAYAQMKRAFVPAVSGTYYFAVKVNENSTGAPFYLAFDDFAVEGGDLGNPAFGAGAFKAYPNPVKDILNVSYTQDIDSVEVFNVLGQKVITAPINAHSGQLDLSGLAAGSYLVRVAAGNQVQTIKVVKQ